jgi:hypothetical protein
MKSTLLVITMLIALLVPAYAGRVHRGRPRENKIFAANSGSVSLENEVANSMGVPRYLTQEEVDAAVELHTLVPLSELWVTKKLPANRRYALPETVTFTQQLSDEFWYEFGDPLWVDSAVRPATVQRSLFHRNRNAAPAYGERASSHERGTTVDLSKRLTKQEYQWLIIRLLYYRAIGRILVIEEKSCFHIFVKGESEREPTREFSVF